MVMENLEVSGISGKIREFRDELWKTNVEFGN